MQLEEIILARVATTDVTLASRMHATKQGASWPRHAKRLDRHAHETNHEVCEACAQGFDHPCIHVSNCRQVCYEQES